MSMDKPAIPGATATSTSTAIIGPHHSLNYAELEAAADCLARTLQQARVRVLATLMDNTPDWVVVDLAAERAGVVHVPLPAFFTPQQMAHALGAAGVDALFTLPAFAVGWPQAPLTPVDVVGEALALLRLPAPAVPMPAGTRKITFTSGTTGAPKGVCLSADAMQAVAMGLVKALGPLDIGRHLCALPLAVLLENIAGIRAQLANGGACITLPMARLGLTGSSSFDASVFHMVIEEQQPDSLILLPQMLAAWTAWLRQANARPPSSLRFVAVGGAAVGVRCLQAARAQGIPAYEGYGLSEGASVQTLNLPGQDRPGCAGRPLPHTRLRVSAAGEIEVAGSLFLGYLGDETHPGQWWPTGDLGSIDADGFVHVHGRRRNVLITSFGRNVSPEWVEGTLHDAPAIGQAVVFGDGQPQLAAVLWPMLADLDDARLQAAVDDANARLPDYARIGRWVRARGPFTPAAGFATANGRPQRQAIHDAHADALGNSRSILTSTEPS